MSNRRVTDAVWRYWCINACIQLYQFSRFCLLSVQIQHFPWSCLSVLAKQTVDFRISVEDKIPMMFSPLLISRFKGSSSQVTLRKSCVKVLVSCFLLKPLTFCLLPSLTCNFTPSTHVQNQSRLHRCQWWTGRVQGSCCVPGNQQEATGGNYGVVVECPPSDC